MGTSLEPRKRLSLPLRYRLPNPPPVFVGREQDQAWLSDAIARAPLTIVCGMGGLGKTALVRQTIVRRFPDKAEETFAIGLQPGDSPLEIPIAILRAFSSDGGKDGPHDWRSLYADRELLVAAAIDLAEARELWVVIDDLHHAEPNAMRALLFAIASFARRARFIATSRVLPNVPGLDEQTRTLGGLADDDLRALAHKCTPSLTPSDAARLVGPAAGSPWRLRQLASGSALDAIDRSLLGDVPSAALPFVEALSALNGPLTPSALAPALTLPEPEILEALEARGIVERSGLGYRLHDVARALVIAEIPRERRSAKNEALAGALETSDDPPPLIEAIRIRVGNGDWARAKITIDAHYERFVRSGYLPALWEILAPLDDASLELLRLRAAIDLTRSDALTRATAPRDRSCDGRLVWGEALLARGEMQRAIDVLTEVADDASRSDKHAIALTARLRLARAYGATGDPDRALACLDACQPSTERERLAVDAARAGRLVSVGRYAEASELLARLEPRFLSEGGAFDRETARDVVEALVRLGRVARAQSLFEAYVTVYSPVLSLRDLAIKLLVLVRSGDVDTASALIAQYAPFASRSAYVRRFLLGASIEGRLLRGDLDGIDAAIALLVSESASEGDAFHHSNGLWYRALVAFWRADWNVDLAVSAADAAPPADGSTVRAMLAALTAFTRIASFDGDGDGDALPIDPRSPTTVQSAIALSNARVEPSGGPTALADVEEIAARIRGYGWVLHEWEATRLVWERALVAKNPPAAKRALDLLSMLAARARSPRFDAELPLFALGMDSDYPGPPALEALAENVHRAPVNGRRARALLGDDAPLDRWDRAVVAALRDAWKGGRMTAIGPRSSGVRGFTIDSIRRAVWLPDGTRIDLAKRALLLRLLEVVFARGGRATKAELASDVWRVADYHPLRDDKRMHVAVRDLRLLIESSPKTPARFLTLDDGYGFAGEARVRRLERPQT